ncbi:non-structural maintenance of chromosomes element 4 homolog A-like [Cynara cardunculus var. scolymus]|uniref:Non-structural maintenance of chromosomes element 4 n=1 Tax=Cynara cardunculus var. scolymus TaxID=59895 RepID=A0A103YHY4_CYNCS|nr:non-structural maintenance of chromosomes element 4 homolog A-like [Cynara cardunculus var. scolymus]KVI09424.1 Non-structural maintenance of chromosome element 4 [Cynara cardunculus var. scolymus]
MYKTGDRKKPQNKRKDFDGIVTDQTDDQAYTERRFLRSGYLTIQNLIRDKRYEIAAPTSKKFQSIIDEVNEMHHLVKKPREQVSDAEALRDLANTLVASIRVQSTGSVTSSVFVSSLITEYGQKGMIGITETVQILWKDIGLHVSPMFMVSNGSCTMLGPMRYETKPLVMRKRRRRSVKEEKVKPEELEGTISKEKTETEKVIATMFDILRSNTNVRVEYLMLNRFSFAQTVENLFAFSFLVKDGRVRISVDKKGCHHASPRNAPAPCTITSGEVAYCHFIFRFDFNDWKLMKSLVGEGLELMPHRIKLNPCGGDHQEMLLKKEQRWA